MKKYKDIFAPFHAIYRLTISCDKIKNFIIGVARLYSNIFSANKVVIIYRVNNSSSFIKVSITGNKIKYASGTKKILTNREKQILNESKELIYKNRYIYPFGLTEELGVIYVKKKSDFNDMEKRWFSTLSEEVSLSLKIFTLYQEEQRIIINSIKSLTKFLDQYVPTSYIHYKKVVKLIRMLGKELNLTKQEITSLEYATMLHDIGKIEIPLELLTKKAPLTPEEYTLIKKHPRIGAGIFKNLKELKPVINIILYHHERYDGKGYPYRIKGEQIPLGARILSVIDAFDAMFFGRPYKEKKSLEEIIQDLKKGRTTQFDPHIVDIFIKILKRKKVIYYLNTISKY